MDAVIDVGSGETDSEDPRQLRECRKQLSVAVDVAARDEKEH